MREFEVGELLYAAIRPYPSHSSSASASLSRDAADSKMQQHALIVGAAVDSLDLLISIWSWAVGCGNLAGMIAACAGTNILMGSACIRDLPIAGAGPSRDESRGERSTYFYIYREGERDIYLSQM